MVERRKPRRGLLFSLSVLITRILSHRPKMVFLSEGFPNGPYVIIANHEGMKTPTKLCEYVNKDFVFWAHHNIAGSFKDMHKYMCEVYLHQKKHLPKWFSYVVGTVISPFSYRYYQSTRFIPVYKDMRSLQTIKTTSEALKDNQRVVIFPEDSDEGYKTKIEYFNNGFLVLFEHLEKKEIHVPIILCYLARKKNTIYVDKPLYYSDLKKKYENHNDIAKYVRERLNSLDSIQN